MNEQEKQLRVRREARRKREIRRKKRIRAVLLLILLIVIIIVALIFIISRNGQSKNAEQAGADTAATEQTALPDATPDATPDAAQTSAAADSIAANLPDPMEENNLLTVIYQADANGGEKTCYLTFDDGPSESVTPVVLDVLRRYNIKATFFTLGAQLEAYPDMARRLGEEGHLIANHSYSHNYDKLYATEESFITEVTTTEDLIAQLNGGEMPAIKLFRFPGGSYNAGDHAAEKQVYKETLAQNGFYYIDWDSLNGDAEGAKKDAEGLLEYLQSNIDTDSSTVVLMHDAEAKKTTAEALPSIIEYLISEGYTFKRLDEIPYIPESSVSSDTTSSDEYSSDEYSSDEDYDSDDSSDSSSDDEDSDSSESSSSGRILSTPATGTTTRTSVSGVTTTD